MRNRRFLPLLVVAIIGVGAAIYLLFSSPSQQQVPYPEGYREWTHVKSMVILEGHPLFGSFGGIHHIYANSKAMKGYQSKPKKFPDGSVIVFDLLEAKEQDNAIVEGQRKVVGVMVKDAKKYKETGGWGFEGFKGDSRERVVQDPKAACFNCHASQMANDYVFSEFRK